LGRQRRGAGARGGLSAARARGRIKSSVGVARKTFRIGNPLRELDAVATAQEVGLPLRMKGVMHLCNGIYYGLDTIELCCILGLLRHKPADVKRLRYKFWAVKTVLNIMLVVTAINKCLAKVPPPRAPAFPRPLPRADAAAAWWR